jgi:polysaccharide export outer membrane protein
VQKPAAVPAFEQLRLLDAISACGGFTALASHTITVRRTSASDPIIVQLGTDPSAANVSNIPLMAGDTVIVPKVGNVFVVGQVKTQMAIPLSGNTPITVMRALSLAGGVNYGAALSKARIIRTTADNQHVEIILDLKKLMYGKQQDVALASDDILFIPSNTFKATLAAGGASVAAALLAQGAYTATVVK